MDSVYQKFDLSLTMEISKHSYLHDPVGLLCNLMLFEFQSLFAVGNISRKYNVPLFDSGLRLSQG